MKSSIQVKELLLKGLSNKEISEKVFISESAVKYHITNMLREHSCKSRSELILALQKQKSESVNHEQCLDQEVDVCTKV